MAERQQDYAVGYGRPPVRSRFRKGRSGNPGGRPRGKSIETLLRDALGETVMIEINGRRRRVSKGEAIIAGLVDRSVEADPRSLKLLFDLLRNLRIPRAGNEDEENDGASMRQALLRRLERLAGDTPEAAALRDFLAGAQ